MPMNSPSLRQVLAFGLLSAVVVTGAHAQYAWVDESGRRQYSDMPPPASVPPQRILKQPGQANPKPPAAAPLADAPKPATPTWAERDAEFRKRRAEKAELDKQAREDDRIARENRARCTRLREYHNALESGERMASRKANGEREYISDEARKRELQDTRRMLAECR